MKILETIVSRRSIRKYTNQAVSADIVNDLLKAGMYAPSARNQQPWHFIVFRDKQMMNNIVTVHPHASMLPTADLGILVCGDESLEKSPGYWPVDCAAATQNILLAAHDAGLGAVWLGVYPRSERQAAIKKLFFLPAEVHPFAIIAVGYPDEKKEQPDRFNTSRIHIEKW